MIIYENLNFKYFNSLRINTQISFMFEVESSYEIWLLQYLCIYFDIKFFVIGNASKVMFTNKNITIPVIYINESFSEYLIDDDKVIVSSGTRLNKLITILSNKNISIFENLYPIPATIGGAIAMNASDKDSSISDKLIEVIVLDKNNKIQKLSKAECEFKYRYSLIKDRYIVLYAIFFINKKEKKVILQNITNSLKYRIKNQPININTCGSLFKNTKNYKAYEIINKLNLNDLCINGVKLSSKHSNFLHLENTCNSIDVINFIKFIQIKAKNDMNIELETEIVLY